MSKSPSEYMCIRGEGGVGGRWSKEEREGGLGVELRHAHVCIALPDEISPTPCCLTSCVDVFVYVLCGNNLRLVEDTGFLGI